MRGRGRHFCQVACERKHCSSAVILALDLPNQCPYARNWRQSAQKTHQPETRWRNMAGHEKCKVHKRWHWCFSSTTLYTLPLCSCTQGRVAERNNIHWMWLGWHSGSVGRTEQEGPRFESWVFLCGAHVFHIRMKQLNTKTLCFSMIMDCHSKNGRHGGLMASTVTNTEQEGS